MSDIVAIENCDTRKLVQRKSTGNKKKKCVALSGVMAGIFIFAIIGRLVYSMKIKGDERELKEDLSLAANYSNYKTLSIKTIAITDYNKTR